MKRLVQFVVVVLLLLVVGGLAFYERPVWFLTQQVHLGLFLARVQSNYVMTPEGRVHYYEAEPRIPGGGIPLVLVHGLADRDESWADQLKRLKRAGFHVYAPDLLGYGRSPKPADSDYSIATQEKFVADFIQSLGLQKTDIGGWSMGGWIVLKVAEDHPDLIDRVVVYDSAGLKHQIPGGPGIFEITDGEKLQRLANLLEPGGKPIPEFVRRDIVRLAEKNQWVVNRSMASMQASHEFLGDDLKGLKEPLLIVWGKNDLLLPVAQGYEMHALAPESELDILEGCGHLAPMSCPSRVAAATADFLKAQPAPQGGVRTLTRMR